MDPLVARTLRLDAPASEVWRSIATAEGLAGWLADEVHLQAVVPGAAGIAVDGPATRRMVVTDVEEGRSVRFTWWDEAAPEVVSTVAIALVEHEDGCEVSVVERLGAAAPALVADATVVDLAGAGRRWDGRLAALVGEVAVGRVPAVA